MQLSPLIDVRQVAIAILQQASGPLHTNEIRQRMVALRGLNGTFQISNSDPLLRVSPGYWGLNDRDFLIKRPEQQILIERLAETLERRGHALHISELNEALTDVLPGLVPPMQICSVALLDHRMRTNVSQYLYLAEWGGPRRQGLGETIEAVLSSSVQGLTQLAQLEGRFGFFDCLGLKGINGLVGVIGANRCVVPTIPIFF